jgi:tetratricopeptide (TPR) repeat protein
MKMFGTSVQLFLLVFVCLALAGCTREAKRDRRITKAEKYLAAKKYQEAELEALNALRLDSKNLKALSVLHTVYYDQGRILKLIPVLHAIESLDTNNITVQLRMARILVLLQDPEKARQRARAVLAKDNTNLEGMMVLAESTASPEEIQEVQKLIEKWPKADAPNYHVVKATLAMKRRDLAAAEIDLQEALKLDSKSLPAHQSLAWIAWTRGDFKKADEVFKSASALAVGQPFEQLRWALFKIRIGEFDEARKILESIAEQHPEFLPAQTQLATVAFEQKRFDDCESIVKRILSQDRSLYTPLELQARLKLIRGATDEAVKDLARLADVFPRVPQIHYFLGLGYLQKREIAEARGSFEKAIAADPNYAEAIVILADLDAQTGNIGKAVSALEQLKRQRPAFVRGRMLLAEAYRTQNALEKAIQEYRELGEIFPKNPQLKVLLGLAYRQLKRTNDARSTFEKALQDSADYLPALNQLLEMDLAAQNLSGASNRIAQLLLRSPNVPEHHFMMARVQIALRQIDQAEASLNKAIELQPEFMTGYDALANIYAATKREGQALAKLEEILKKKPGDFRTLMQQGVLLERMGQTQKAIAAYQQLLDINPNFVSALNNIAYLSAESGGDLNKALEMATKATQLVKDNPALQDTLGWILFKRGETLAAAEVLEASAAKLPDNPDVQFHYGMAAFSLSRPEVAREAFERALKTGKDFAGKAEAQARLEMLALAGGKGDAASITKLENAHKNLPKDVGVLLLLGESYQRAGEAEKARRAYTQVLGLHSNSLPALLKLAGLTVGNPAQADQALKLARAAYPLARNDAGTKHQLAKVALSAGDHAWASRVFQEVAETTRQPEAEYDLALCQFWMGNVAAAEGTARQALAKGAFARSSEAQKFLEVLKLYSAPSPGRRDLASSEALLKAMPDWPPALLVYAQAQERAGASNEARRVYEKMTAQSPLLVPAAREYARFLTDVASEPAKAQSLLEQSMKIAPLDAPGSAVYGEALYLTGSYTNAIKALRDSTRAGNVDPESYYYLGLAYGKVGDKPQSKRMLNEALSLKPNHKLSADAREVLDRYDAESKLPGAKAF